MLVCVDRLRIVEESKFTMRVVSEIRTVHCVDESSGMEAMKMKMKMWSVATTCDSFSHQVAPAFAEVLFSDTWACAMVGDPVNWRCPEVIFWHFA